MITFSALDDERANESVPLFLQIFTRWTDHDLQYHLDPNLPL